VSFDEVATQPQNFSLNKCTADWPEAPIRSKWLLEDNFAAKPPLPLAATAAEARVGGHYG